MEPFATAGSMVIVAIPAKRPAVPVSKWIAPDTEPVTVQPEPACAVKGGLVSVAICLIAPANLTAMEKANVWKETYLKMMTASLF